MADLNRYAEIADGAASHGVVTCAHCDGRGVCTATVIGIHDTSCHSCCSQAGLKRKCGTVVKCGVCGGAGKVRLRDA